MSREVETQNSSIEKKEVQRVDTKELEFPDTIFVRDIENRVFQTIILQCLSKVEGVALLEGTFLGHLLGRNNVEGLKGIQAEQNNKNQSVSVKVEVNISYGIPIPEKAEEIQTKISEEITNLTGLHVASVHVVFKNVILPVNSSKAQEGKKESEETPVLLGTHLDDEYTNEF